MLDKEKVIKGLECCLGSNDCDIEPEEDCPYKGMCLCAMALRFDVLTLLKEQEVVKPKTIPEELKLKMWNALYAKEDKLEEKYIGTKEQNSWFLIYRSWLQEGFNLAIKAIADWEGG